MSPASLTDRTHARHGKGTLVVVDDPTALASFARDELAARSAARPLAGMARFVGGETPRGRHTHHGVAEPEVQRSLEVGAALGALATRAATEEAAKDVAQIAEVAGLKVETARSPEPARGGSESAYLVVLFALDVIAQHVIRPGDLLELLF